MTKKKPLVSPIEEPEPEPDYTPSRRDTSRNLPLHKGLIPTHVVSPSSVEETVKDEQIKNKEVQDDRVRVVVEDLTGKKRYEVEITTEVELQRLIPVLINALGLPTTDNSGQPVTYYLTVADRRLLEDETLASAGVLDDTTLTLVPNEMTARYFPAGTMVSLPDGTQIPIERLKAGEALSTTDNGEIAEGKRAVEAFAVARIGDHHMDSPLVANKEYKLLAVILGHMPAGPTGVTVQSSDVDVVEIDTVVRAVGMEVLPHWMQKAKFLRGQDSGLLEFRLIPREVGQKQILVEFYYQRHWLAKTQFQVEVVE